MDEMDTSSSTGSASEKLSEGEETPTSKGDVPEPMVGSPPLFTAIPSTSAMITTEICHEVHNEGWMSPKKDAMEGIPTDLTALTGKHYIIDLTKVWVLKKLLKVASLFLGWLYFEKK